MSHLLSFDVESFGLYGEGFAVGAVVIDDVDGVEQQSFFASCPVEETSGLHETSSTYAWLKEKVLPHLPLPVFKTTRFLGVLPCAGCHNDSNYC